MRSAAAVVDEVRLARLGARLRDARRRAGLSQHALAARAGVPQRTIANWEQGKREPGLFGARALARALGLALEELLA